MSLFHSAHNVVFLPGKRKSIFFSIANSIGVDANLLVSAKPPDTEYCTDFDYTHNQFLGE